MKHYNDYVMPGFGDFEEPDEVDDGFEDWSYFLSDEESVTFMRRFLEEKSIIDDYNEWLHDYYLNHVARFEL